ncbi:hypothetical protein MLD38_017438 [Melastoma candidum]|uniref:Uncharacterized protein n=1 Tax=Melastoma candidum TaxID=119954 RepID=A0ACB9QQK1_9MYRT|nr:hypothetical protein MLD38_017438 [Melastoma candidum]
MMFLSQDLLCIIPGDESIEGKMLRLKQYYTLCSSASLQDIIARFVRRPGEPINWDMLPQKVAVQVDGTHPTLYIPELIRILIDVNGLTWEEAWKITQRTVIYTNHTVVPEALDHKKHRTNKLISLVANNEDFQAERWKSKRRNKMKVAAFLREKTRYVVSPDAMFDEQVVKRIHEYKRDC